MKIAFITELFYPSIGGQEVRYLELGRELVKKGHSVVVYTTRQSPSHPAQSVLYGIEVKRVTSAFQFQTFPLLRRNPLDILRFTWDVVRRQPELAKNDALIFNIWPVLPAIVGPRLIRQLSVIDWCEIRKSPFWTLVYHALANPRARHISVNHAIQETLFQQFGVPLNHTSCVESGISSADYRCEGNEKHDKTVLFLGRLAEHKNPLLALDGFIDADLFAQGYTLHFAGDGPLGPRLRQASQSTPGVFVHGTVDTVTKLSLLKRATLLVLPSRREGFPRVIAEAAAAGTPTLTTTHPENGGVTVVNRYKIGWVCSQSVAELGASMKAYAVRNAGWEVVSSVCREVARARFDWSAVATELTCFLKENL